MTSHDVVDVVRRVTGERKVGHAGTLDPNATGLLIVGVGRAATKQLGAIARGTIKEYETQLYLGEVRDTHDAEGNILSTSNTHPTADEVHKVLAQFVGTKMQIPPMHSAVKLNGKKAYELARAGKMPQLAPRKVMIYSIESIKYAYPLLSFTTKVSSGTYIRALARDIGAQLGTGAYLANLRRTLIGEYSVNEAVALAELHKTHDWHALARKVLD